MNTAATQGVSLTQTGKRPIAWTKTKRVNVEQELLTLSQPEPEVVSYEQDFLEAIGQSEQMLNTPPMDQADVPNTQMSEFESPEMDAEWDMHAELEGLRQQPTERDLFSSLAPAEAEHDLFACVAPAEAEGRVPPVTSEVTIANNNMEQLNINNFSIHNSCQLISELNTSSTLLLEPVAPDNLAIDIAIDQENNPELASLTSLTNDTWMQECLGTDNFNEDNFLDSFVAAINNDITVFPVETEVNPEPLVPTEPEKEKPSSPSNILEQAIGETLYPVDNVSIEVIDHADEDEDEEWEEKPKVRRVKKVKGSKIVKKEPVVKRKTVGRPARQGPIPITEIPEAGLTEEQKAALKYRRMRDLNNEASRKCRKNRKAKINQADSLLEEERAKNDKLRDMLQRMEAEMEALKSSLAKKGINPPDFY